MSFDPSLPINNAQVAAAILRGQFNGLKDLIITDVVIDGVTTLNPGDPATAAASVVGTVLHLSLGIPRGNEGAQGIQGTPGNDGAMGNPGTNGTNGIDGEVTNSALAAALAAAISGTSNNTNAVATLDTPFADPDAESMRQRFNELVIAARR